MIRRHKSLALAGLAAFALVGGSLSLALFTDTETDDSTFTAGTISLDATKIDSMDLTNANMMPGDMQTSPVEVDNTGSSQLRYAVSQTSDNTDTLALRDELEITIFTEDTGAGTDFGTDGNRCDDQSGTELYATATLGASSNLIGDATTGGDAGDRTLNSGASEWLCFYVAMPLATGDAFQAAATTTTFTFAAEQTANNP